MVYDGQGGKIYKILEENSFLNGCCKLYLLDAYSDVSVGVLPYLKIKAYNMLGEEKYSLAGIKRRYKDDISQLDIDEAAVSFDKSLENIGISAFKKNSKYKGQNHTLYLNLLFESRNPSVYVYEMSLD